MTALEFAERYIVFEKTSLITGPFEIRRYPFLREPLLELDNIDTKVLTLYKASGCMGTVFLQIALAKRILCDVGDMYFVAQTEDDSKEWSVTRGVDFIFRIPDIERLKKFSAGERQIINQGRWLFRHKWLLITGPGKSARQSKQVRYVFTDESHLEEYENGALQEFDDRRGSAGWTGQSVHSTTAPDVGREVDQYYCKGGQNEWHWQCLKCNELFWPLWKEFAEAHYNGTPIFTWKESASETETLDSLRAHCPHCGAEYCDNSRTRFDLVTNGAYVPQNDNRSKSYQSYGWSAFCGHWITWKEIFCKYLLAVDAYKMQGDLSKIENFTKKQLCRPWEAQLPDLGEGLGENNYERKDIWEVADSEQILSVDFQAGEKGEGSHLWALRTQWCPDGSSRRLDFVRIPTWNELRAYQLKHAIKDCNVYVDSGYDNRTVFVQCGLYHWYAVRGEDSEQLMHRVTLNRGKENQRIIQVPMPYGQPERQDGNIGKSQPAKLNQPLRGKLPPGWCLQIVMANKALYGILYALHTGRTGRYFGVPRDMPEDYIKTFEAFKPVIEKNKKTNKPELFYRKVKTKEHAWDCEVIALVGAMRAGLYPLAKTEPQETQPELVTA